MQHTLLSHCDVCGVGKVDKSPHHLRADVTQGDLGVAALFEAAGEHGSEVRATGGQHHLVHLDEDTYLVIQKHCIRFTWPMSYHNTISGCIQSYFQLV